jgi:hypothetical protein
MNDLLLRALRRPFYRTTDPEKATLPWVVYRLDSEGVYTLSPLGVLNGLLNKVGLVLVVTVNPDTQTHERIDLRRKWW